MPCSVALSQMFGSHASLQPTAKSLHLDRAVAVSLEKSL